MEVDASRDGDMAMDRQTADSKRPLSILTFPVELLIYILSFLSSARDKVSLSRVSRLFRCINLTPSLWREIVLPHLNISEKPAVENVLEFHGGYIRQLRITDHVTSFEVELLQYCKNVVQLRILTNTSELQLEQLEKAMKSMRSLQCLDILWTNHDSLSELLLVCANLQELTIRISPKVGVWVDEVFAFFDTQICIHKWAALGFLPRMLNIVSRGHVHANDYVEDWSTLNSTSPNEDTSYLKFYNNYKLPMAIFSTLPTFQLEYSQSCCLPFVKASNYGLLGIKEDVLSLTSHTTGGKTLHKATLVSFSVDNKNLNSDLTDINFVTHFDASCSKSVHCGHLEQLALACPNLLELNLEGNTNCLRCLQGLLALASSCTGLRGLNLSGISAIAVESRVQLWQILASLRLAYLAIEWCVMIPHKEDIFNVPRMIALYKKCLWLRAVELSDETSCDGCKNVFAEELLLNHFPSLDHCIMTSSQDHNTVLQELISSCGSLQVLKYTNHNALSSSVEFQCILRELYIESHRSDLTDTFMYCVSSHGGLVNVVLSVRSVTGESVAAMIANSPNLTLYHVHTDYLPFVGTTFSFELFDTTLKRKFSNRKLFCCGSYNLRLAQESSFTLTENLGPLLLECNTSLTSLWESCSKNCL